MNPHADPTAHSAAHRALLGLADRETRDRITHLLATDQAEWVWDPYVEGVVGLIDTTSGGNRAIVIVYLNEDDFEVNVDALLGGEE